MKKPLLLPIFVSVIVAGILLAACSNNSSTSNSVITPSSLKMELFGARGSTLTAVTDGSDCPSGEKVTWTSNDQTLTGHMITDPDPTSVISATVSCGRSMLSQTLASSTVSSGPSVFSVINPDKTVTLWGSRRLGGDSSSLTSPPRNVKAVYLNQRAAAILQEDGTVITLGRASSGGDYLGADDYTKPNLPLNNVSQLWALNRGFLAQNSDGTVSGWGNLSSDGDITPISTMLTDLTDLQNIKAVASNRKAVAVLKNDGRVLTFGDAELGGDSQAVASKLFSVADLVATNFNMTALKYDGSIVVWGQNMEVGEAFTGNEPLPQRVVSLTLNDDVLSTLDINGGVSVFGDPTTNRGADRSMIGADLQSQVAQLYANKIAFAALKKDGSVITWGDPYRNNQSMLNEKIKDVKTIAQTAMAFAALHSDGTVTTWGDETRGGDSDDVQDALIDVVTIASNDYAFAAIKKDGSVVTWGSAFHGGSSQKVADQLKNIRAIYSTSLGGFLAVNKEGGVVAWGSKSAGGALPANNLFVPFLQN